MKMGVALADDRAFIPVVQGVSATNTSGEIGDAVTLGDHLRNLQRFAIRHLYKRNETIFHQDDKVDYVYKIVSGTVRLCRSMPNARRHILDFLLPGDVMGFAQNLDQKLAAEAVTDVMLFAYPRVHLDRLARDNPAVHTQLIASLSANLLNMQQQLMMMGCKDAKERVAAFLLHLADRSDVRVGERLDLTMGRQDIADHLGLAIETVSRVITCLRSDGIILVPNIHQLVLRDLAALKSLADEG